MVDPSGSHPAGLRERKKARTRKMLIDTAVDLCLSRGYENTTVEQISDAVSVSPRTFNRYFASKDAVFIAVIDDLANEIAAELDSQQSTVGPLAALRAAHIAVLTRAARGRVSAGLTAERIMLILRVVYSSPTLRQAAIDYRCPAAMEALAAKMGVATDDPRLELAVAVFSTTIVSACRDIIASGVADRCGPDAVMERLEQALTDVSMFTAELELP
ncbi:TetR/AcrR family transcriptional regulator [Mycolicibacterium sp. 050158]|uniref:TetR/AcrR family transcriptional regulator n=1 Tax=Mycolicibacterium sp. 050158 TaxID=3090602 RepID=UPI00299EDE01|nr:TetR family transcriptional regulator [Mycolicibacterium sp. 050158]MDX1891972.1 TetR family transcriptional regulator [Mycolicibacterium sp. 050158]